MQGNAGDSRTVLGIKGRAKPLSFDHKPQNEGEKARIVAAGGFVDFGRVNGNLALSRAIGDFEFKKSADLPPEQQIVTALPDVTVHEMSDDDEFLVVACDGMKYLCESLQLSSRLLTFYRYLGLPIFPSGCGVRTSGYCREAGTTSHMRKHDGQLPCQQQRNRRRRLRQYDNVRGCAATRQEQGGVVQDGW